MGRARLTPLAALAVLSAAGCGVLVSLDGLTGGGGPEAGIPDGTASDVGPEAAAETGADSGADAGSPGADSAADARPADGFADALDAADAVDAPTPSDGPVDASPDAPEAGPGPVACADAGVILCEDFENGLDPLKWPDTTTTNATVAVQTPFAHRGSHALQATSSPVASGAGPTTIAGTVGHQAALPSTFYERLFVYIPAPVPSSIEEFTVALQSHAPYDGLQLQVRAGNMSLTDYTGAGRVKKFVSLPLAFS